MILSSRLSTRAFSLVEVTLALGVAAFCLVAIFGLLPVGVNSNQAAVMQTSATSAVASIVADLRATPKAAAEIPSPLFGLKIPASDGGQTNHTVFLHEDGSIAAATGTKADVNADPAQSPALRATVFFYPPGANQRAATTVRVLVTWPALADPTAASIPSRYAGSVEVVAALDRN